VFKLFSCLLLGIRISIPERWRSWCRKTGVRISPGCRTKKKKKMSLCCSIRMVSTDTFILFRTCSYMSFIFLLFLLKELHEVRMKSAALQMHQFVGEEKNDLLDYLRSLQPEKVIIIPKLVFLQNLFF
jgi:hypothetical protein